MLNHVFPSGFGARKLVFLDTGFGHNTPQMHSK